MFKRLSTGSRIFAAVLITGLAIASIAAVNSTTAPTTSSRDLKINSTNDSVGLTIQKSGTQSANALEIRRGGTLELAIPGSNTVAVLKTNLGFQAGRCVSSSDGTVTNTFGTAFSSAPKIYATQYGTTYSATNAIASITTSNFVIYSKISGVTNDWVAIGAP